MLNNLCNSVFTGETQSTLSVGLFLLCILVALTALRKPVEAKTQEAVK